MTQRVTGHIRVVLTAGGIIAFAVIVFGTFIALSVTGILTQNPEFPRLALAAAFIGGGFIFILLLASAFLSSRGARGR